ncbi:MAG: hypothetical protein V4808_12480 [Pseudomonadota bacterium]
MLAGLSLMYVCWVGQGWMFMIVVGVFLGRLLKASGKVAEYRDWKRAWDSMNAPAAPRRPMPWKVMGRAVVILLAVLFMATHADASSVHLALGCFIMAGVTWAVVALFRAIRRRVGSVRAAEADVVRIAARPMAMRTPAMQQVFDGLPEYCQTALRGDWQ